MSCWLLIIDFLLHQYIKVSGSIILAQICIIDNYVNVDSKKGNRVIDNSNTISGNHNEINNIPETISFNFAEVFFVRVELEIKIIITSVQQFATLDPVCNMPV